MEQEFRVRNEGSARQDTNVRIFFFSVVLILLLLPPFSMTIRYSSFGDKFGTALAGVAVAALVAGIVGAFVLANRSAVQRMKRACVWRLTDNELIRTRQGWPDVRIGLSEKASLYSRPGWLVVHNAESGQEIAIPEDVERFSALRRELTKHFPAIKAPRRQSSILGLVTATAAISCCVLVFTNVETAAKIAALAALLLLQGGQTIRIGLALRQSPKRVLVWSLLGMSWVFTLVVFGYLIWRPAS